MVLFMCRGDRVLCVVLGELSVSQVSRELVIVAREQYPLLSGLAASRMIAAGGCGMRQLAVSGLQLQDLEQ